jgi:hypothetical protein
MNKNENMAEKNQINWQIFDWKINFNKNIKKK